MRKWPVMLNNADNANDANNAHDWERLPNWLTVNILHTEGIVGKLKRDAKIFGVTSAEKGV